MSTPEKTGAISPLLRKAIWEAHEQKCVYTGEILSWDCLQIDHILPQSLWNNSNKCTELQAHLNKLQLPLDYPANDLDNLIPCKALRNAQKSDWIFDENDVRFFRNIARKRRVAVEEGLKRLTQQKQQDKIVSTIEAVAVANPEIIPGLCERLSIPIVGTITQALEKFQEKELERIREYSYQGEHSRAIQELEALQQASTWQHYTSVLRAKVLRQEAVMRLNLRQPTETVAQLLTEAHTIDPTGDFQTADAYLAYCQQNISHALQLLVTPRTIGAQNFRWALLLELKRVEDIEKEISTPHIDTFDSETYRLLALHELSQGKIAQARISIENARAKNPTHRNIRIAKAKIDFYAAHSPAMGKYRPLGWPAPVSPSFIRTDTASVKLLSMAADEFAALSQHAECSKEERDNLKLWHFACIASIEARKQEADVLIHTMLSDDPAHYEAVIWANQRGFSYEETVIEPALRARIEKESDNIELRLAHWELILRHKSSAEAEAALNELKEIFHESGNADIWLFYKVQFHAQCGETTQAQDCINRFADSQQKNTAELALQRITLTAENKSAWADYLADSYQKTGDPRQLLECCEIKHRLGDYEYISKYAQILVEKVGTATVLALVLDGTYHYGDAAQCLTLLQENRNLLPDGDLAPALIALKAECLRQVGQWPEALREAEALYQREPSLAPYRNYFNHLINTGDTRRCTTLARDLLSRIKNPSALDFLRASQASRHHDLQLSRKLWHRANNRRKLDLPHAELLMQLGYNLGLTEETDKSPHTKRVLKAAKQGKGSGRLFSFDELRALFDERQKEAQSMYDKYSYGAVPIHMLSGHLNVPLVSFYHVKLEANSTATTYHQIQPLLFRSGSRSLGVKLSKPIIADITSIILARHLDILELVEKKFGPLYISPHLTTSLQEQINQITPAQADIYATRQRCLELIRTGVITTVSTLPEVLTLPSDISNRLHAEDRLLLECAYAEQGIVLLDSPIFDSNNLQQVIELPETHRQRIYSCREFKNHLQTSTFATNFTEKTSIFIPLSQLQVFGKENLENAARRFRLHVSADAVVSIHDEITAFERAQENAQWTQELLNHIIDGIDDKTYQVLRGSPSLVKDIKPWTQTELALIDLFGASQIRSASIWIDDRGINQFPKIEQTPTIGISEILSQLHQDGALTSAKYYDTLLRLRQSHIRYLPFTTEEILHHLNNASLDDNGVLHDTDALCVLRRSFYASLLESNHLKPPSKLSESKYDLHEFEYVATCRRAFQNVLLEIWKDRNTKINIRRALADWVLYNLIFDLVGVWRYLASSHTAPLSPSEVRANVALQYSGMILESLRLEWRPLNEADKTPPPRQAFNQWITKRILEPLQQKEGVMLALIGKSIAEYITPLILGKKSIHKHKQNEKAIIAGFIYHLPKVVLQEIDLAPDAAAAIGLTIHKQSVTWDGQNYDAGAYWDALAEAYNKRPAQVFDREGQHPLQFERKDDASSSSQAAIAIKGETTTTDGQYADILFCTLDDKIDNRIKCLEQHPEFFDCPSQERSEAIRKIALIASTVDRVNAVTEWQKKSTEVHYLHWNSNEFKTLKRFSIDDFTLPDFVAYQRHLRIVSLPEDSQPSSWHNSFAETLVEDESLLVAIQRLTHFPIKLPDCLATRWKLLNDSEALAIWDDLNSNQPSILTDLHLIYLAALRNHPEIDTRVEVIINRIFDVKQSPIEFKCLQTALYLSERQFATQPSFFLLPIWARIACVWYNASRLHGCLRDVLKDQVRVSDWLLEQLDNATVGTLMFDPEYSGDNAASCRISFAACIIHGLAVLLSDVPTANTRFNISSKYSTYIKTRETSNIFEISEPIRPKELIRNKLDTFIGGATQQQMVTLYAEETQRQDFFEITDATLNEIVTNLEEAPLDSTHWASAGVFIGAGYIPDFLQQRFTAVIQALTSEKLATLEPQPLVLILHSVIFQITTSKDIHLKKHFEDLIFQLVTQIERKFDDGAFSILLSVIIEALQVLSYTSGDDIATAQKFFDYLRRLINICPSVVKYHNISKANWLGFLPCSQQTNIWPYIMTARTLS